MIYLEIEDLIHVAERVLGTVEVRDFGLIASAVARPQSRAFGEDAYPTIHHKAAALIHSIARSHALVDGNKRLSLAAAVAFYGMNGFRFTGSSDFSGVVAHRTTMELRTGQLGLPA